MTEKCKLKLHNIEWEPTIIAKFKSGDKKKTVGSYRIKQMNHHHNKKDMKTFQTQE